MRRVNRLTVLSRAIAGSASAGPAIAEHRLPFFGSFSSSKSGGFAKYGSEPLGNSNPSASLGGAAFFSASATSLAQEAAPRSLNFYNKVKETMRQSQEGRALRQLTLSSGKSAGRNSSGRITIFHRGGGLKRLQRRIDLKRSTSSIGIVERIEYDPNRSSRIALVRWIEGVHLRRQRKCNTTEKFTPPHKILEPTTTTVRGLFSLSSLPRKVEQRKVACFSPGLKAGNVVVGHPTRMPPCSRSPLTSKGAGSENSCAKDVFFSAFSSTKAKGETASFSVGSSCGFPRIAVAGAKAAFFAPQMREEARGKNTFSLGEIRKWRPHSILWAHRIKRKAALSW